MGKNRTMAAKNAKVVQFAIEAGKTAMAAEVFNMPVKKPVSGLALYSGHMEYMERRRLTAPKVGKWVAKAKEA